MLNLSKFDFQSIKNWMYRNARPLDLARWKFHFENGEQETAVGALMVYQNEDGGFGNALEPDSWNPRSSPYSTYVAVNYLEELKFRNSNHGIIKKILKYLTNAPEFTGDSWPAVIASNNDYPHAPWWSDTNYDWGFTPTVLLAGFILFYTDKNESMHKIAASVIDKAIEKYLHGMMPDGKEYSSVRREAEI